MPTPTKPFKVLSAEKKSHRTKAELKLREEGENIDKNDAIYEAVINRYCLLQAECYDLEDRREEFYKLIFELKAEAKAVTENLDNDSEVLDFKLEYAKSIAKMMTSMLAIDKQIQTKRKMLLDIEKENVMTIASALRSIPKKVNDEKDNPLLKVLRGET